MLSWLVFSFLYHIPMQFESRFFWMLGGILGWSLFINALDAQPEAKPYFQQAVHYTIQATLDDQRHTLTGQWTLQYTNQSPDTLSFIYCHVWANAYQNRQTAFAKQLLRQGRLDFHFARDSLLGGMDQLDFTANGKPLQWATTPEHIDILKINLAQPLLPGDTVVLETPFRVRIPGNFSRLAHLEQAYYLCQWYPKPAVYDREGWHPMPYLDYGEYYSEFGSYDVTLTLPANYVVGATGVLQTPSEQAFMDSLAQAHDSLTLAKEAMLSNSFPPSSPRQKTIRYTAERVHDFAWFADKRFKVQHQTIVLPSGRTVENYNLFTRRAIELWNQKALRYARQALLFYSEIVGEYPYPTLTIVQANYQGNDMEYPMITAVNSGFYGPILENVIVHEIGHNWFYGILGSNERDYPWMDEGMNTYLDERYMRKYHPNYGVGDQESYHYAASRREDQPIQTHSDSLTYDNYYLCGYAKPALAFSYLEQYLGQEALDQIFKNYYQQWQFKHPQPEDVRRVFEESSPKPVDWFFEHLIQSTDLLDYAAVGHHCCAAHAQAEVRIRNKGDFKAPVLVSALDEQDSVLAQEWVEGLDVKADTTLLLPEAERYVIDVDERMPEYNRNNNVVRSRGPFKTGKPTQVRIVSDFFNLDRHKLWLLPLVGYNHHDGVLIGATAYSLPVPRRPWQYAIMPLMTTATGTLTGMADLRYHHHFGKHHLMIGARFKSFHKRRQDPTEERPFRYAERYYKPVLLVTWDWAPTYANSPHRHQTGWSSALIGEEQAQLRRVNPTTFAYDGKTTAWRSTHRLHHTYTYKRLPTTLEWRSELECAHYQRLGSLEQYLQLTLEAKARFWYSRRWGVDVRAFVGGFLWHTDRQFGAFPLVLAAGNRKDYHYGHLLTGRGEQGNVWAQQLVLADGGFKVPLEEVQFLGASNTFLAALNFTADLPLRFPLQLSWLSLKPFADVGYALPSDPLSQGQAVGESIWVSAGLLLELGDGLANFYVPLLETNNLGQQIQSFTQGQWWRRLTFSLHFNQLYTEKTVEKWLY